LNNSLIIWTNKQGKVIVRNLLPDWTTVHFLPAEIQARLRIY